jgi:hypothetical protein
MEIAAEALDEIFPHIDLILFAENRSVGLGDFGGCPLVNDRDCRDSDGEVEEDK